MSLPEAKYFEYGSHLYHSNKLIPYDSWKPSNSKFDYSESDKEKFNNVVVKNKELIENKKILDLGCHTGYMLYIASQIGATSGIGLNIRPWPLEVARYYHEQLGIKNTKFIHGDIEDIELLKRLSDESDTAVISTVLEHVRNPELILRTISESKIQNLIIESTITDDDISVPRLTYYLQDSKRPVNAHDGRERSLGSVPNQRWLETVLYHHGWRIIKYEKYNSFLDEWFATQNLDTYPFMRKIVCISAIKEV